MSAMSVGVAALVAILSFGYSLERSTEADAVGLLGADMRIASPEPFESYSEFDVNGLGDIQALRTSFFRLIYRGRLRWIQGCER